VRHHTRRLLSGQTAAAAAPAASVASASSEAAAADAHVVDAEAAAEAQRHSLEILEWPAVCRQVGMGAKRCQTRTMTNHHSVVWPVQYNV
jgi:hypothetical protein